MGRYPLGDAEIDMGQLVNRIGRDKVAELSRRAVQLSGGVSTPGAGRRAAMGIMQREIFGAEPPMTKVSGLNEAIRLVNDTKYGLTSSIDTTSPAAAMHAAQELSSSEIYVNRENFEATQGFHAGAWTSGIGGADGRHVVYAYTATYVADLLT